MSREIIISGMAISILFLLLTIWVIAASRSRVMRERDEQESRAEYWQKEKLSISEFLSKAREERTTWKNRAIALQTEKLNDWKERQ